MLLLDPVRMREARSRYPPHERYCFDHFLSVTCNGLAAIVISLLDSLRPQTRLIKRNPELLVVGFEHLHLENQEIASAQEFRDAHRAIEKDFEAWMRKMAEHELKESIRKDSLSTENAQDIVRRLVDCLQFLSLKEFAATLEDDQHCILSPETWDFLEVAEIETRPGAEEDKLMDEVREGEAAEDDQRLKEAEKEEAYRAWQMEVGWVEEYAQQAMEEAEEAMRLRRRDLRHARKRAAVRSAAGSRRGE